MRGFDINVDSPINEFYRYAKDGKKVHSEIYSYVLKTLKAIYTEGDEQVKRDEKL